ncbi:glycosyltransferase [Streptomyces caelestis]|uniref:glycosyltransferase n=1 Tax=Streptomyces caelestis TaxID=36816 RepID=UPI00381684CF
MAEAASKQRRIAVVWLMLEGGQVSQGGVARYVENLLRAQDSIRAEWLAHDYEIDFILGEPFYRETAAGYDAQRWKRVVTHLAERGGRAVRLVSDSDGIEQWGGDRFFHALSAAGAQLVLETAERYDGVIAISGTSAFAQVAGMVQRLGGPLAERILHVHTFGLATHETALPPSPAEIAADGDVAFWTRQTPNVTVAYISDYTARLYERTYAIPRRSLLPNRSGIPLDDPLFTLLDKNTVAKRLAPLGLPDEGRLAVMWGRNSAPDLDKGYHLLLEAAADVPGVVPVIANRRPAPDLQQYAERLGVQAVFLADQPFETISALLQSERTLAAAFLGEAEPGAVSPMEAMWVTRRSGAVVIAADTGNLPELVDGGRAGILTARTGTAVAEALRTAQAMAGEERTRMRETAADVVREHCDFLANIRDLVSSAVSRWSDL